MVLILSEYGAFFVKFAKVVFHKIENLVAATYYL